MLATAIVNNPEEVTVDLVKEGDALIFDVHVADDDMGRIIGKKGRIVSALRTVVRAAAGETGVNIEISEV